MNNEKQSTVKKSIRIPKRVAEEIEKEAAKKNQSFSDTVNYRLQHFQSPLTPAIMGKIQDIANKATEAIKEYTPQKADNMQKEVAKLWKYLK